MNLKMKHIFSDETSKGTLNPRGFGGWFLVSFWGLYSFTRPFHGFSASPFVHGAPAGLVFSLICFEVSDFSACLAVRAGRGGLGN